MYEDGPQLNFDGSLLYPNQPPVHQQPVETKTSLDELFNKYSQTQIATASTVQESARQTEYEEILSPGQFTTPPLTTRETRRHSLVIGAAGYIGRLASLVTMGELIAFMSYAVAKDIPQTFDIPYAVACVGTAAFYAGALANELNQNK